MEMMFNLPVLTTRVRIGVKESGYGREGGRQGIEEYLSVKSIFMNVAG